MIWLSKLVGERAARIVAFAIVVLVTLAIIALVVRCSPRDDTAQRQADQTTRSSDAIAGAAANAIETIDNRTVTEADVDAAVDQTVKDIQNAPNDDAVRAAVLAGVCGQASHRNDPACTVR